MRNLYANSSSEQNRTEQSTVEEKNRSRRRTRNNEWMEATTCPVKGGLVSWIPCYGKSTRTAEEREISVRAVNNLANLVESSVLPEINKCAKNVQ